MSKVGITQEDKTWINYKDWVAMQYWKYMKTNNPYWEPTFKLVPCNCICHTEPAMHFIDCCDNGFVQEMEIPEEFLKDETGR